MGAKRGWSPCMTREIDVADAPGIGSFAGTCFDRYRPDGQTEPSLRRALISNQPHRMQTTSALAAPPRKNYVTIGGASNRKLSRFKALACSALSGGGFPRSQGLLAAAESRSSASPKRLESLRHRGPFTKRSFGEVGSQAELGNQGIDARRGAGALPCE
jgi:hypothetical protein